MTNLRRKERKPGNVSHMKLGRKRKLQKLGRLTFIIAGKGTTAKEFRRNYCIGSRLLSSAQQDPRRGLLL